MLTRTTRPQIGAYALLTAAAVDPVTVDEVMAHTRIDTVAEGREYLSAMISSATEFVKTYTGRALTTETWTLTLDEWPLDINSVWWNGVREGTLGMIEGNSVEIRKAPFLAVSSVKTVAEDGTLTTFSSANYYTTTESGFGRLLLRSGCAWPDMSPPVRQRGGILITFTAGYGEDPQTVPSPIRHAIKMLAADYYENREAIGEQGRKAAQEPPLGVSAMLSKYRVLR